MENQTAIKCHVLKNHEKRWQWLHVWKQDINVYIKHPKSIPSIFTNTEKMETLWHINSGYFVCDSGCSYFLCTFQHFPKFSKWVYITFLIWESKLYFTEKKKNYWVNHYMYPVSYRKIVVLLTINNSILYAS